MLYTQNDGVIFIHNKKDHRIRRHKSTGFEPLYNFSSIKRIMYVNESNVSIDFPEPTRELPSTFIEGKTLTVQP